MLGGVSKVGDVLRQACGGKSAATLRDIASWGRLAFPQRVSARCSALVRYFLEKTLDSEVAIQPTRLLGVQLKPGPRKNEPIITNTAQNIR